MNADGLVHVPYIQRWAYTCTLRELVITLVSIFSNEPPLFSKPPVREEPIPSWVLDASRIDNNHSNGSNSGSKAHGSSSTVTPSSSSSSSSPSSSSTSTRKSELIEQVTSKMQSYMHQRLTMICEEIDTELWTQQRLNDRIQKIEQQQRDLKTQAEKFKESKERVCDQINSC